jgi:hypothetical protein
VSDVEESGLLVGTGIDTSHLPSCSRAIRLFCKGIVIGNVKVSATKLIIGSTAATEMIAAKTSAAPFPLSPLTTCVGFVTAVSMISTSLITPPYTLGSLSGCAMPPAKLQTVPQPLKESATIIKSSEILFMTTPICGREGPDITKGINHTKAKESAHVLRSVVRRGQSLCSSGRAIAGRIMKMLFLRSLGVAPMLHAVVIGLIVAGNNGFVSVSEGHAWVSGKCVVYEVRELNLLPAIPLCVCFLLGSLCMVATMVPLPAVHDSGEIRR